MPLSTAEQVIRLVRAGSSAALAAIAEGLESGVITLASSPVGITDLRGVSNDLAAVAYKAFATISGEIDENALAVALRTASGIRTEERLDRPHVEICWTGPDADGPLVTPSAAAIKQLLSDCRETGEILLVGYSFTVPEGSFMEQVIELLCDASRRRARIQIVLHHDDQESNKNELLKNWDLFARKPLVYTWDPHGEHPYTKLHAKCLVVDRLQMLVTSANFTYLGLESNIELGLLVRNQPLASAVHERFDHLINSKVLTPWDETP